MVTRITRHLVGLLFWTLIAFAFVVIAFNVVLANYVGTKAAFELLGFEMRPLATDELVGVALGAFFPDATLAHLYALAVALTLAGSNFLMTHLAFHIFDLIDDRRIYLDQGDAASARAAMRLIVRDALAIAVLLVPVILATSWDIDLFRYRSVAGALAIDDPETAARTIKSWELQLDAHGDLFAFTLARSGAVGYLAITILSCVGLEFAFRKTRDTWTGLLAAFGELMPPMEQSRDAVTHDGYDENDSAVYDPHAPLSYDADGEPLEYASRTANEAAAPTAPEAATTTTAPPRAAAATSDNREGHEPSTDGGLFTPPSAAAPPSHPVAMPADPDGAGLRSAPQQVEPDLYDVIGGTEGERVTLKAARADHRRYHIDVSTNRIRVWRREHWARVHEPRGSVDGIDQPRAA